MKKILIGFLCFILLGCANFADLEKRVSRLEQLQYTAMPLTELAGAGARWRINRTGDNAIEDITGMVDGDFVLAIDGDDISADIYFYRFDADSTETTDDPKYIEPSSGDGCWVLSSFHTFGFYSEVDDGDHYIDIGNTGNLNLGSRADGRCWYDKTDNRLECYDGTNIQYWTPTGTE